MQRPSLILRVRELEAPRVELLGKLDDRLDPVEVVPVQDDVDREREAELARQLGRLDLLVEGDVVPAIRSDSARSLSWMLIWT